MPVSKSPGSLTLGPIEWALLLALAFVWGGSFFFGAVALDELPPLTVLLARVGLAAVALNIGLIVVGRSLFGFRRWWGAFLVMGLINNVIPFGLILWGQTHIASGLASILNAATPVFTVLLAHYLTRDERLTGWKLGGVLMGFAGVAAMIGPEAFIGFGDHVLGEVAIVGAALSYAFASIWGRRFRDLPPVVTATGQVSASTLLVLPIVLVIDQPWRLAAPGAITWGALIGLALASTALAYVMYFRILRTAGASNLMLVTLLVPVFAIAMGVGILGETLAWRHIIGMAVIGLGLLAIDGRLPAWLAKQRASPGHQNKGC